MAKVKWAVWGSCGIAKRRTIPEGIIPAGNAELVSVFDVNTQGNEELARQLGVSAAKSERALLKSPADAIYIATPANLHYKQVLAAAKAGKHVLCEKPMGMTVAQSQKMVEACTKAGVKLGTGFMMRFHAYHLAAKALIDEGRLGKPVLGRAQLSCWYPPMPGAWRQDPAMGGGGSLMDMGGHCIDLLEMFFGPAKKVSCFTGNTVHAYASEDSATAIIQFASGAQGMVDTFFCVPDNSSKNRLELYGSKGSILAEGTVGQGDSGTMTAYLEAGDKGYQAQQARDAQGGIAIAPQPRNIYKAEIEEFSSAILDNRPPAVDGPAGLWSQKVLIACYKSAKTGKTITIE